VNKEPKNLSEMKAPPKEKKSVASIAHKRPTSCPIRKKNDINYK
jgi:hypothetical protein